MYRDRFVLDLLNFVLFQENGHDEELRIESDDDDEAGGCKNGNDDIMDLEDMGDYIETSVSGKVNFPIMKIFE